MSVNTARSAPNTWIKLTAISMFVASMGLHAEEFDLGIDDLSVRWDNTIRYAYGKRVGKQDPLLVNQQAASHALNNDDGDRNFPKNSTVTSRFDLLSELDLIYAKRHGIRVSGSAWYDDVYAGKLGNSSQNLNQSNHFENGVQSYGISSATERYAKTSGEFLDAFIFTGFDIGDMPVNIKAGRHTVYWGEGLGFTSALNGISYSQMPLDIQKGLQAPGAEAKEIFRPREAITASIRVNPELSFEAQKFFKWDNQRLPNAGTYLGVSDVLDKGGESLLVAPGIAFLRGNDVKPSDAKDYGVSMRWSPDWLGGTFGLYHRRYGEMLPIVAATPGKEFLTTSALSALGQNPSSAQVRAAYQAGLLNRTIDQLIAAGRAPASAVALKSTNFLTGAPSGNGTYQLGYGDNVKLYGFSVARNIEGVSTSLELSYRENTPINSFSPYISSNPFVCAVLASSSKENICRSSIGDAGDLAVARGNTVHAVVSALGLFSSTPVFDSAAWSSELNVVYLNKVTKNADLYKGQSWYTGIDKPTRSAYHLSAGFTPTWFQALPSTDVSVPLSLAIGVKGNSATIGTISEGAGTISVGLQLTYQQKYSFDLRYIDYRGQLAWQSVTTNGAGTAAAAEKYVNNGILGGPLRDRDQIILTFKTAF